MFKPVQMGKGKRYTYAQINEVLRMPHLLDLQRDSYKWFQAEGLRDILADISPIESNERGNDKDGKLKLYFGDYHFEEPKYDIRECKERDATFAAPLRVKVRLENAETGEIQETEVFMGDIPLMTDTGTFIINGAERVIVSQLVRSPGVYFAGDVDNLGKELYNSTIIPNRGAWIELESDGNDVVHVRIDRNRKLPATIIVRALGFETNEEIIKLFGAKPDLNGFLTELFAEEPELAEIIKEDEVIQEFLSDNYRLLGFISRFFELAMQANKGIEEGKKSISEQPNLKFLMDSMPSITGMAAKFAREGIVSVSGDEVRTLLFRGEEDLWEHFDRAEFRKFFRAVKKRKGLFARLLLIDRFGNVSGEPTVTDINAYLKRCIEEEPEQISIALGHKLSKLCGLDLQILHTLVKDVTRTKYEALIEIYKRLRPGEPPSVESATSMFNNLFFDPRRYDLAHIGRYKLGKKLGWESRMLAQRLVEPLVDEETGEIIMDADSPVRPMDIKRIKESGIFEGPGLRTFSVWKGKGADRYAVRVVCNDSSLPDILRTVEPEDIIANVSYLLNLIDGIGNTDDIDHLGNRRLRCVGELLQNQFRIGLTRMERTVKERMATQDRDSLTPQTLLNIRPVTAVLREFFGSSQLSQFMDQTNPLAELTHKRRLSALGPGGLSRERAGFEVRDVHHSHYGRMCPIETPEGPNIGLISSLATFAKVNKYGLIETPYRIVRQKEGETTVTEDVVYVTADAEENLVVAQANEPLDEKNHFVNEHIASRLQSDVMEVDPVRVDLMDVSPKQVVSVGTALIPFLENDDANRALMGANMQRQAVPLLKTQAPLVGTGMEHIAARDSGVCVLAKKAGTVERVTAEEILVRNDAGELDNYPLIKFVRSNQSTCINQHPLVNKGDRVEEDEILADGMSTDNGELALGYNVLVAFVPWEGYNYEDAILISEELAREDIYTSIHIEEYECDARDTKLGAEEITRQLPNVSEDSLRYLDEDGIISIGAEVRPGDVLVGKVTPKGETEQTPEERLLRAIFGDKEREVRDTSLRVPHGESGKIVDVRVFTRENDDELNPGVNKLVRVYIAQKRKIHEGDKMAGRHGNKGVVSRVLRQEDMPFLPDGTPVQIVLNPLGVPSRMNIGQILETHLGWAVQALGMQIDTGDPAVEQRLRDGGYDVDKYGLPETGRGGVRIATPVFDGASEIDVFNTLKMANLPITGKTVLYDGRTGERMDNEVTVGYKYMLKLHHLVDDKIHARSTGPYSLVTQQPLGGKAQFGGQRFGEMEVWALEAYGAAYTLQEMLTVKSDDVVGRVKAYEKIVKGENIPEPGVPESFKVLLKELQSIGLDVSILNEDGNEVIIKELDDEDTFGRDEENELRSVMEDEGTGVKERIEQKKKDEETADDAEDADETITEDSFFEDNDE